MRDKTLAVCLINTGFRISEILSLDIGSVVARITPQIEIAQTVTVNKKNIKGKHRNRTVKLNSDAKNMLK